MKVFRRKHFDFCPDTTIEDQSANLSIMVATGAMNAPNPNNRVSDLSGNLVIHLNFALSN